MKGSSRTAESTTVAPPAPDMMIRIGDLWATLRIEQHLAALSAGIALPLGRLRSDGQRLDRIVGMARSGMEQQRPFGAHARRKHLALLVAAAENLPAAQTGRSAYPEFGIGSVRPGDGRRASSTNSRSPAGIPSGES